MFNITLKYIKAYSMWLPLSELRETIGSNRGRGYIYTHRVVAPFVMIAIMAFGLVNSGSNVLNPDKIL